jgi:hypothetical protein
VTVSIQRNLIGIIPMKIVVYKLRILGFVCSALLWAGYSNAQRAISSDINGSGATIDFNPQERL